MTTPGGESIPLKQEEKEETNDNSDVPNLVDFSDGSPSLTMSEGEGISEIAEVNIASNGMLQEPEREETSSDVGEPLLEIEDDDDDELTGDDFE